MSTPAAPVGGTGVQRATVRHAGGVVALRDVTLLAEPGEVLAVLGPSGSGKTSLLRAIAGVQALDGGEVVIGGRPVAPGAWPRDVSAVFADDQLLPFLDVARNMRFGLDVHSAPRTASSARVGDQARGLRVSGLLPRMPATLSRGERGRVGIGRALVRAPAAFLLDEPLLHLDAGERATVRRHLRKVVSDAGVTTLYVTHDCDDALLIGDRVAVLNEGALVQVAPPRELYWAPADTFVAQFVASSPIGLLAAEVIESAGVAGYRIGARVLPTWAPVPPELAPHLGQAVLLGIRAEDVHEYAEPEHATLHGTVVRCELTGRHATVGIDVDGVDGQVLTARFDGRTAVRPGDPITVGIDAVHAHVFDARTGRALAHPAPPAGPDAGPAT